MQNEACHNLNIYDFLIMPIQRIPRYQMLIEVPLLACLMTKLMQRASYEVVRSPAHVMLYQSLSKYTPQGHGDYENLGRAKYLHAIPSSVEPRQECVISLVASSCLQEEDRGCGQVGR